MGRWGWKRRYFRPKEQEDQQHRGRKAKGTCVQETKKTPYAQKEEYVRSLGEVGRKRWVGLYHEEVCSEGTAGRRVTCMGRGRGVMCSGWSSEERGLATRLGRTDRNVCGLEDMNVQARLNKKGLSLETRGQCANTAKNVDRADETPTWEGKFQQVSLEKYLWNLHVYS